MTNMQVTVLVTMNAEQFCPFNKKPARLKISIDEVKSPM